MSETTLEVLIERIENLQKTLGTTHQENKEDHQAIMTKQDYTNGKVRSLQIWKASIVGAIGVIVFVATYTISDYMATKREFISNEKQQALNMEKILHLERELDKLR